MRTNKSIITKKQVLWGVRIAFLASCSGALVLGSVVATQWQLPVVIGTIAAVLLIVGTRGLSAIGDQRAKSRRISRDVAVLRSESKSLKEAVSRLEIRAQKDEARHRQIAQLVLGAGEGVARLEARAHADEVRMRHVGQLAKQAADTSETITKIYEGMKLGAEKAEGLRARPVTSGVKALSTTKSIGRLAAAVADDGDRARKLHQALNYENSDEMTGTSPAGVIGTRQLIHYLGERGTVTTALLPGYSKEQLNTRPISVLIIEEASFSTGPWFGTDSPQGTAMFNEIQDLCVEAKKRGLPIYIVRTTGTSNVYSRGIRDLGYVFPSEEFDEKWAMDTDLGLMQDLQEYATRESN